VGVPARTLAPKAAPGTATPTAKECI
jgi:hypothetical protein